MAALLLLAADGSSVAIGPDAAGARRPPDTVGDPASALLRIGVEVAALPLVNPDRRYAEEGHEVAFARALGVRLGVEPVFVGLPRDGLVRALAAGDVDVVLARSSQAARDLVGTANEADALIIETTGYRSGVAAAMRSDTPLRDWPDLAGRTICLSRAHERARALALQHGARTDVFDSPAQALVQLRLGHCDASLHDAAQLDALFQRDEWRKFSATLVATAPTDLVLISAGAASTGKGVKAAQAMQDSRAAQSGDGGERAKALHDALVTEAAPARWQARHATWAANVAFEVYFDQLGPDCH